MIQQTTALRKIASLRKKIKVIRGGQGSGKTISILILLINHASSKSDREIFIVSSELTKMRFTVIKDFVKVMRMFGVYEDSRFLAGTLYKFPNGSEIKFIGLDKEDVGKGLRSHVTYFNEVNKVDRESYTQVASRAGQVYMDYNPDASFFIDEDVIPRKDSDFLQLTFQDNEQLPGSEREEILNYYLKGYGVEYDPFDPEVDTRKEVNEYWSNKWRVYGLGEIGMLEGVVFKNWKKAPWPKEARLLYYGCDFGYSISKFAIIGVFNYDGAKYLKSFVYSNELTNQQGAEEFKEAGYTSGLVYCDSAEPKSIAELQKAGINAVPCDSKQDIKDFAIQELNTETFYVDENDKDTINELEHWRYNEKTQKPQKSKIDHIMDGLCYGVGSAGKYSGQYL